MLVALVILLLILFAVYYYLSTRLDDDFPPGPRFPLPVMGDGLALEGNLITGLAKLRKKYGDIVGMWLGPFKTVILHDYQTINEVFNGEGCAGRVNLKTILDLRGGGINGEFGGILFTNGKMWQEQRRHALHSLRDLGFGKSSMDEMIAEQVQKFCDHVEAESKGGEPFYPKGKFNVAVLNSLWTLVTGEQVEYGDAKIKSVVAALDESIESSGSPLKQVAMIYPALSNLLEFLGVYREKHLAKVIMGVVYEAIQGHEKDYQLGNPRDFIDKYFDIMSEAKEGSSFRGEVGKQNLKHDIIDFLIGGSETSSTTLMWAMLYLAKYPDTQAKLSAALQSAYGTDNAPSYTERSACPYAEAFILEVQRLGDILPTSFPHLTTKDINVKDPKTGKSYKIPEGTQVISFISSVMSDPENFEEPNIFRPERFLTPEGEFKPDPRVVSFGLGKRRCLGETLARMTLFHFITGIVQRFQVRAPPGETLTMDRVFGQASGPKPYRINLIPR